MNEIKRKWQRIDESDWRGVLSLYDARRVRVDPGGRTVARRVTETKE